MCLLRRQAAETEMVTCIVMFALFLLQAMNKMVSCHIENLSVFHCQHLPCAVNMSVVCYFWNLCNATCPFVSKFQAQVKC